jgi:hypothetical protein
MEEQWQARRLPQWEIEVQREYHEAFGNGTASTVTDTVGAVSGKQPRTFDAFAREHEAAFISV